MNNKKRNFLISGILLLIAITFTILVKVVDVKQIGVNTSKLEDISKSGNITSVNNGKNIVVNNNQTKSQEPKGDSRNAKLASKIAKGY